MTNASILIVGDDADAVEMLRVALEADGYPVQTAGSGRAALDRLRSSDVGCILLDLNVTEKEGSGFLAAQRRDRALASIPVIVLSSRPDAVDLAQQLGARACLRKPFSLERLHDVVAHAVGTMAVRGRH